MRNALALAFLLACSACGFSPLYQTTADSNIEASLGEITLAEMSGPDQAARLLLDEMQRTLPLKPSGGRYDLRIKTSERRRSVVVTRAAETTRFDYDLRANYVLTDTETGARRRQSLNALVNYGIVDSQFASLVGEREAIRRAAQELARKIEIDIALFLKGRPPAASRVEVPDVLRDDFRERADEAEEETRSE